MASGPRSPRQLTEDVASKTVTITFGKPRRARRLPARRRRPIPARRSTPRTREAIKLAKAGKIAEARKIYEDLLAKYPTYHQLNAMLAQMYAAENNVPKAMRAPQDRAREGADQRRLPAAPGRAADGVGRQRRGAEDPRHVDIAKVKNPRAFINSAIHKINSGDKVAGGAGCRTAHQADRAVPERSTCCCTCAPAPTSPRPSWPKPRRTSRNTSPRRRRPRRRWRMRRSCWTN